VSIGDEPVLISVFGDELDEPQPVFDTLERDLLVNNDTFGFPTAALLEVLDQGAVFKPGDEENAVAGQRLVPRVVGVAAIMLTGIQF